MRVSSSTATTRLAASSSFMVRLPVPGPISSTTSVLLMPALSTMDCTTSGFFRMCCPLLLWNSMPAGEARRVKAITPTAPSTQALQFASLCCLELRKLRQRPQFAVETRVRKRMRVAEGGRGDRWQFCTRGPEMPPPPNRFAVRFATPPAALRPLDAIAVNLAEYCGLTSHTQQQKCKFWRKCKCSVRGAGGSGAEG